MNANTLSVFVPILICFALMWLLLIRPQKKQQKAEKEMRNSLQPGDNVVTVGGIVGTVLSVKEDSVILYVGNGKAKIEFKKWAIAQVPGKADSKSAKKDEGESKAATKRLKKKEEAPAEAEVKENADAPAVDAE